MGLPEPYKTNVICWRDTERICQQLGPPKIPTEKLKYQEDFVWSPQISTYYL